MIDKAKSGRSKPVGSEGTATGDMVPQTFTAQIGPTRWKAFLCRWLGHQWKKCGCCARCGGTSRTICSAAALGGYGIHICSPD